MFVAVTCALGSSAPLGSDTTPAMLAVVSWPHSEIARLQAIAANQKNRLVKRTAAPFAPRDPVPSIGLTRPPDPAKFFHRLSLQLNLGGLYAACRQAVNRLT